MTFDTSEFLLHADLDEATLEIWVAEGWLVPAAGDGAEQFRESDLARARLIRDLMHDLGVNAEGIGVVLHLVDQIHGLRGALAEYMDAARRE